MKRNLISKFFKNVINYMSKIDICIYIILMFCFLGLIRNLIALKYFGFNFAYFNTKLFFAMFMLYLSQIGLILLRQRIVALVSLMQVVFCIWVYRDFTFLPIASSIISPIKNIFSNNLSYGWEYFIGFAIISFLFSLEIIKTYLLYTLTDQLSTRKKVLPSGNDLK